MEDDWDLHAVVRSCSSSTTTATAAAGVSASAATVTTTSPNLSNFEQDCNFSDTWFRDPFEARRSSRFVEDLHELWKPFLPQQQQQQQQQILPISPLSVLQDLSSSDPQQKQQEIKQFPQQKQQLFSIVNGSKPSSTSSHHPSPRSKKRKNHSKKVCHVTSENLSSDMWSWRKYGQKPIKGSPYPRYMHIYIYCYICFFSLKLANCIVSSFWTNRGYYKCSTSKGCMARKQVERNRSDPGMFIITYTGDHNHPMPTHRNSLAGSTRNKPSSDDSKKPSSPPEKIESSRDDLAELEDDDEDDDFFAGLEDFTGECPPEDHLQFPWLPKNATTTTTAAAGGG
ncbi:hypothetical protein C2S51_022214 [Perilla frutescens var. frutescens]|nr:hypothetical protein C2S51_022214 [Perilla frutescens var. frutescens]